MKFILLIAALFASLAWSGGRTAAQDQFPDISAPDQTTQGPAHTGEPEASPEDRSMQQMEQQRLKKANEERHLQLKRDADKLLQLATELKQAVDKSKEHTLSLQVMKKAAEIEKLAKSVREKMRGYN